MSAIHHQSTDLTYSPPIKSQVIQNGGSSLKKIKILTWLDSFKRRESVNNNNNSNSNSNNNNNNHNNNNSNNSNSGNSSNNNGSQSGSPIIIGIKNHNNNNNVQSYSNPSSSPVRSSESISPTNCSLNNSRERFSNMSISIPNEEEEYNSVSSLSYSSSSNPSSPNCISPPNTNDVKQPVFYTAANTWTSYDAVSFDIPPIPFPTTTNNNNQNNHVNNIQNNNNNNTTMKSKTSTTSTTSIIVSKLTPPQVSPPQIPQSANHNNNSGKITTPDRDSYVPEMKATIENFHKTIGDPKSFIKFKTYMENSQSMENLNFFLEIERYKKIDDEGERKYAAADIWRRFFEDGGSYQLGLESSLKKMVEETKSNPTRDLFDEVQNQVLEDMVCDAYRHFLSSPFNQEWRVTPILQNQQSQQPQVLHLQQQGKEKDKLTNNNNNNNNNLSNNDLQQLLPASQPQSIQNEGGSSANNLYQQLQQSNGSASNSNGNTPTLSPNQLSISIYSPEHPEFDVTDLQYILDEVVKNNLSIHNEIHYSEVLVSHWLASGASGRVYLGQWKGRDVAIKVFGHELNVYFDENEYKREVALMTLLKHESLVQCFGSGCYGTSYFHLTEYCQRGSLTDFLKNQLNTMDLNMKLTFAMDIAQGMKYLHSMSIIHRDLKSMNILLTDNLKIKIIDFGSSRIFNKSMTCHVGTSCWMAPEVFTSKHYTNKVDVYSYGVILWEIFTRKAPHEDQIFGVPFKVTKGERPDLKSYPDIPPFISNLIKKCWSHKPNHRPSFAKICGYLETPSPTDPTKKK